MVRGAANRAWPAICGRGGPRSSNGDRATYTLSEDARRSPLRSGQAISLFSFFLAGSEPDYCACGIPCAPRSPCVASARLTLIYGLLPQVGNRSILISDSGFSLQSYIRHLEWDQVVPCRHGICVTTAPIVESGKRAAERVTGVEWSEVNPNGHDGRSISLQAVEEKIVRLALDTTGGRAFSRV